MFSCIATIFPLTPCRGRKTARSILQPGKKHRNARVLPWLGSYLKSQVDRSMIHNMIAARSARLKRMSIYMGCWWTSLVPSWSTRWIGMESRCFVDCSSLRGQYLARPSAVDEQYEALPTAKERVFRAVVLLVSIQLYTKQSLTTDKISGRRYLAR